MPFPKGLKAVGVAAPELVPWAWGVNGFFTVIGSIAAVILGMAFGFRFVLGVAAFCYLLGLAAIILSRDVVMLEQTDLAHKLPQFDPSQVRLLHLGD
jgi:hypothetical protein